MTGPKCTGTRSPPPENRGPGRSGCSYRVVRSGARRAAPPAARPARDTGALRRAGGRHMDCSFPRHAHAVAIGLHRRDTRLRRGPGARDRAATRPAPPPPGLRGHDPGLRRSAPRSTEWARDLRPGVRGDLLRRRRRHPERGRAAGPAPPDPVRADPERLRQSLRRASSATRPLPAGGAPAGRGGDPAGGRRRWRATSSSSPTRATASSTRSRRRWRKAGASRAIASGACSPTTAPRCGRSGARRWPRSASRWTARWPPTRRCWSRWPTWRPIATS